jgi:hypothetical protein
MLTRGFLIFAVIFCAAALAAESFPPKEYQVKAAFLYNFGKFVQWPATAFSGPNAPLVICVLGTDPFEGALDQVLSGKTISNRPISVRRPANLSEAKSCHILFVGTSEKNNLAQITQSLSQIAVLTVSDLPHFVEQGGSIQFLIEHENVHFEINLGAAQRAGLKISSKLLQVAQSVIGGDRG